MQFDGSPPTKKDERNKPIEISIYDINNDKVPNRHGISDNMLDKVTEKESLRNYSIEFTQSFMEPQNHQSYINMKQRQRDFAAHFKYVPSKINRTNTSSDQQTRYKPFTELKNINVDE